jgi:conjugative transfer pilus assembly protein TraH
MATGTDPGVYQSQTRGFAVGGRLSIRANQATINPFSVKMPSVKAGCGGIDIFGGSFSWINADQLIDNMKAVGQNALGYAFSLGLEAVCPMCQGVLNELQHFMNQMFAINSDTCKMAKSIVNSGVAAVSDVNMNDCITKAVESNGGDYTQGWLDCASGSESEVRAKMKAGLWSGPPASANERPPSSQPYIDQVRQALNGQGLSDEDKIWAIALLGTRNPEGDDGIATGCQYYKPRIGLLDLIEGGDLPIWECADGTLGDNAACKSFKQGHKTMDKGYRAKTKEKLYAIYEKLATKTGSEKTLTTEEQTFIDMIPVPVFRLLNELALQGGNNTNLSVATIGMFTEFIAMNYAWASVEKYIAMAELGQSNVTTSCSVYDPEMKESIRIAREAAQVEMNRLSRSLTAQLQTINFINDLIVAFKRNSQLSQIRGT